MARLSRALEEAVIGRAAGRCEYCHFPAAFSDLPFHVDHIIAEKHDGPTEAANLAWACFSCNLRKGPNIAGIDPTSRELTRIFHPRSDAWTEHFAGDGPWLCGTTPIGRTTIAVLDINDEDSVAVRAALLDERGFDF